MDWGGLRCLGGGLKHVSSFNPTWGDDPIFFKWVEIAN